MLVKSAGCACMGWWTGPAPPECPERPPSQRAVDDAIHVRTELHRIDAWKMPPALDERFRGYPRNDQRAELGDGLAVPSDRHPLTPGDAVNHVASMLMQVAD